MITWLWWRAGVYITLVVVSLVMYLMVDYAYDCLTSIVRRYGVLEVMFSTRSDY